MKAVHAAALILAVSLGARAALGAGDAKSFSITLKPGDVHEECLTLEAGQKRAYYWKSDAPVDFDIHFHDADKVSYPVKREAMRGDGGTFAAKSAHDYCWMWTARDKSAKVEGKVEAR
jgi:hypothetical protein